MYRRFGYRRIAVLAVAGTAIVAGIVGTVAAASAHPAGTHSVRADGIVIDRGPQPEPPGV